MATTPFFAVEDARTEEEHDHFGHPMPLVSAALKGVLAVDGLDGARRLLPSIAYVSGLSQLNITNILMVGGGCLVAACLTSTLWPRKSSVNSLGRP